MVVDILTVAQCVKGGGNPVNQNWVGFMSIQELFREFWKPPVYSLHKHITPGLSGCSDPYVTTPVPSNHPNVGCQPNHPPYCSLSVWHTGSFFKVDVGSLEGLEDSGDHIIVG